MYRTNPQQGLWLDELIIDNFAGGGGASTGIEMAIGRPVDIAINHDADAIAMHTINHPHTKHYCDFPKDYIIDRDAQGNPIPKYKQVARCGNSVCPDVAAAIVRSNYECIGQQRKVG